MDKTHVSQIGHPLCHLKTKKLDFSYFTEKILVFLCHLEIRFVISIKNLVFLARAVFVLNFVLPNVTISSPARQSQEPPSLLVPVPVFKGDHALN